MTLELNDDTRPIEDILSSFGFRHERDSNSCNDGRHMVFDKYGLFVGRFDAFEAAALCQKLSEAA